MIKILINGTICPLVQDDRILVNKRFMDIENPEQKTADWSQSFLIQNTPAVARLFGQIFEVNLNISNTSATNFNPDFNPNLKAKCAILNDNVVLFNGWCQLNDIELTKNDLIRYSINAYATIGNFFNDIKNLTFDNINLAGLNHDWTKANIENSWTTPIGDGYVYPMIDYGLTNDYNRWCIEDFRPAIFVKTLWDKIFSESGWSYTSNFINSTRFKSLIIPFNYENLFIDNTEILSRSFTVATSGSTSVLSGAYYYKSLAGFNKVPFSLDTGSYGGIDLYNNVSNDFNTTTYQATITQSGKYIFTIGGSSYFEDLIYGTNGDAASMQLLLVKNGLLVESFLITYDWSLASSVSDTVSFNFSSLPIYCSTNDVIDIRCGRAVYDTTGFNIYYSTSGSFKFHFSSYTYLKMIAQPEIQAGDEINFNSIIPKDIKQVEFITSLAKMFNLQFEQVSERTLLVEPLEDYWTAETSDWTAKLDVNNIRLIPMGMNEAKEYNLTYEQDTDVLNDKYFSSYQEVYGRYKLDVLNDFLTTKKEIKPIFASTPLFNVPSQNDRIISSMAFVDDKGGLKQGQTKLRILYWGGLINCKEWYYNTNRTDADSTANIKSQYPYAGHLDNPYTPAFDLNYGVVKNVYYDNTARLGTTITFTDSNLWSNYWQNIIRQITDRNSKILEGYFYLNQYDWLNISFRKQYYIKEAYYRLIEISDYDITGTNLTKCKFLKINPKFNYITSSKPLNGGNATFDAGGKVPTRLPQTRQKDGGTIAGDKAYDGKANYNAGQQTLIKGSQVIVPNSTKQALILSNNVIVNSDKVIVANSDNADISRPGALINNVYFEYKLDVTVDDDFIYSCNNGVGQVILPALADNEYYQINKFFIFMSGGTPYDTQSGTNDIHLSNGNNIATIAQADWIGMGGIYIITATYNPTIQLGHEVIFKIDGQLKPNATANIRIIIYYNIITL